MLEAVVLTRAAAASFTPSLRPATIVTKTKMRQEFIIGEREQVGHSAKKNRWRVGERSSWLKPDGTYIHCLRLPETVAHLEAGSIVHVLGMDANIGLPPRLASRLKIVPHRI